MVERISFGEYLVNLSEVPVVDVRTPAEFESGHIPGAVNIPLFSNDERAHVGTVYKQQSQEKAMELGYRYVTPKLTYYIKAAREASKDGMLTVYCWRGGMRSKAFADHIHENGIPGVSVIEGGYKEFRRFALESFDRKSELQILGGYTGTGKTRILQRLAAEGQQVIDLEGLANHKGSAFGGIGQEVQPTTEHFANLLFWKWKEMDLSKPVWLEDESSNIGRINIPENFYNRMRESRVWFLNIPKEQRARLLVDEYASFDPENLAAAINRISKKLGGLRTTEALAHLMDRNYYGTALITLDYYDKYYLKGLNRRDPEKVLLIESGEIDPGFNASLVLQSLQKSS